MVLLSARGADDQCLALDPVPQVAARVPHRRIGLHVAPFVSGPHGDHMLAGPGGFPGVLPGSEGIGAMIRAQRCCYPAPAVVLRELHLPDSASTTKLGFAIWTDFLLGLPLPSGDRTIDPR